MPVDAFYDELLTFLERREARLLSWGFYDVAFRASDVEATIASDAPASLSALWDTRRRLGETLPHHFGMMADAGLLYRIEQGGDRFRTRFAEGVRLTARLRQMFNANQWATAPTLVADIKLHLRPRLYPSQDQPANECWGDLEAGAPRLELQRDLFHALAHSRDGSPMAFAGFQRRTFSRVFHAYGRDQLSGSIVSAGTGAGKTKAFYVPAFLQVAAELGRPPFTKILAIYPRNVLLADQLREALSEAEKLKPVLRAAGLRPIRIGALLGQTPWLSSFDRQHGRQSAATRWHGWDPAPGGYKIPFIRSPERAEMDLIWRDEDRRAGRGILYPADGGAMPHVEHGTLAFTRDDLLREPPDILFLSAEMLNREMGNPAWERVLGLGQPPERAPRLLLLDEIHAYEGASGAQIAWILRRWRYWAKPRTLHIVGLSATLRMAPEHLSQVAGLSVERIEQFEPFQEELTSEAQEYNIAVKGDAGSGANLLSTTIQCGMLLARLLTPLRQPPASPDQALRPEDFYGSKVFAFTDNIDVINRWLSDMVDAERNRQLAALRLHPQHGNPPVVLARAELRQMDAGGQIWELPRRLGHDLTRPLGIGRCSSQDPGLDADMELTVATSSLEVGFDDPNVGAVLQHKSPMSLASFVQRKGRAGRRRGTRPWTVVVLSDYGRDRWDFQQIERLFEPQIEKLRLPIANPYILRIQAVYFMLDWLGRRLGNQGRDGPFAYFRRPTSPAFHRRAAHVLGELLARGPAWQDFRRQLARCLRAPLDPSGRRLSESDIDSIVWDAPRPLLREVVPTLLRKLEADWRFAEPRLEDQVEDSAFSHPLPEFLPRATFADLDVSEVAIRLPGTEVRHEFLTVSHALFETCPGRVSKRFAVRPGERGYWHPFSPNLIGGEVRASVADIFPDSLALGEISGLSMYQPQQAALVPRDPRTRDSSYATWEWHSCFRANGQARTLPVSRGSAWSGVFERVEALMHQDSGSIEVTRLAQCCRYEILPDRGLPRRGRLRLMRDDEGREVPEAVGFRQNVDGLRFHIRPEHIRSLPHLPADVLSRFRPDYFLHLLQQSPLLQERAGGFRIEWLWQTSVAMLTATALRQHSNLQEAQHRLANLRSAAAERVLSTIFRSRGIDPNGVVLVGRQQGEIRALWDDPNVRAEMERFEVVLWGDLDDAFHDWVRDRYLTTLANALRSAVASRRDDIAEEDLSADVAWEGTDRALIYVTEQNTGGLGQIEQIWQRLVQDPSRLLDGLEYALTHCPKCQNTAHVLGVVARSRSRRLVRAFQSVRQARDITSMESSRNQLRRALRRAGLTSDRPGVVSLLVRVLRPGSSVQSDALLHGLNRMWRRVEQELGISIDLRVFAYYCVEHRGIRRRLLQTLRVVCPGQNASRPQLYALVQQMLLLDCQDSCPECLDQPNRYARVLKASRALAGHIVGFGGAELLIDDTSTDWVAAVKESLRLRGAVRLRVTAASRTAVASRIPEIIAEEIEVDYLLLPLRLRRVDRLGTDWLITLELKDSFHA